jgi:hypothetical protein
VEVTDDVDEWRKGEAPRCDADTHASDGGRGHRGGEGRHLREEPTLADARLAADDDDARLTGRGALERFGQRRSLGNAANEDRTGNASCHDSDIAPACRLEQHAVRCMREK